MVKGSNGKKLQFTIASQDGIKALGSYVDQVLDAVGHPEALVTDESTIGDFLPRNRGKEDDRQWLDAVASKLGLESVAESEYVWQVAKRVMRGE